MLNPDMKKEISAFLHERDSDFRARQLLTIRDEVGEHLKKAEENRRNRFQFLSAVGGISLVALVAFAYSEIQLIAQRSARDAVKEPLTEIEEAEKRLEAAVDQFENIREQISTSRQAVELTQQKVQRLLGDVEEALGEVRAAQGGVSIANDLSRIYRRLEQMEFSSRNRVDAISTGPTILDILPGENETSSSAPEQGND
ncbi:hypothetical protein [Leisingera caerulea]|uniref:hypothetical protein n=1 Tax=Leisingera caerulea TaxID=506591 RepID=UPI003F4AE715